MDDAEVIDAFLEDGSGAVFSPSLNVERGCLKLDGWWSAAFRVTGRTVLVRDEPAPDGSSVVSELATALTARGLTPLGADFPAIVLLTYTVLDLGYAPWVLWSTDRATGEAELNAKATEESFLEGGPASGASPEPQNTDHARGGRRVAGMPTRVLLAVGLADDATATLEDGLADCRVERRALGEIAPDECGSLLPTLVLVDATGPTGSAFVVALQASDAVRAPVVAVTTAGEMRAGADATVDATRSPDAWLPLLHDLLG
jgi:hypothetical protein